MCYEWYDELELAELLRMSEQEADKLVQSSRMPAAKQEPGKDQKADRKPQEQADAVPV